MNKIKKLKIILVVIFSLFLPNVVFSKSSEKIGTVISNNTLATISTILHQKTIHPGENDFFGVNENSNPICRVDVSQDEKKKNKIAITFDSAYINKYTYQILDILDEYNVKATFFMTRGFLLKNKKQVKEILKKGHEIGNHSTSHPNFKDLTEAQMEKQINAFDEALYDTFNIHSCLFRFPYGAYNRVALDLVKRLGYYPIQWHFDSLDWRNEGADVLIRRFTTNDNKLVPGAIILFHNGAEGTPEALPTIINQIYDKDLSFCKVSDLIYENDFSVNGRSVQQSKKYLVVSTNSELQKEAKAN